MHRTTNFLSEIKYTFTYNILFYIQSSTSLCAVIKVDMAVEIFQTLYRVHLPLRAVI